MATSMTKKLTATAVAAAIAFTGITPPASAGILDILGHGLSISAGSPDEYESYPGGDNSPVAGNAYDEPHIAKVNLLDGEPAPVASRPEAATTWPNKDYRDISLNIARIINERRVKKGLPQMRLDPAMSKGAQQWAQEMARLHWFDHDPGTQYGEIIAMRYNGNVDHNALRFVDQWEHSAPHRELMYRSDFHVMGVGVARSKNGEIYGVVRLYFD